MRLIQQEGRGAVVYLRHEAMGTGLVRRLQTLDLGERDARAVHTEPSAPSLEGEEPALCRPGPQPLAQGAHGIGSQILRDLGVRRLRLITNHPFTPKALEGFGLRIEGFVPVPVQAHASP
jgi:3,4-dihydroxy 2-butanone 4-phosphate synthase/GTP cyclohydrolase II